MSTDPRSTESGRDSPQDPEPPVLDYAALRGRKRELGLVTVASFWDAWEANLALGKLRAEGIEATLADQNIVSAGGGLYANLAGGIKLQVAVGDAERARAVLPQRGAPVPVKCPKCGFPQTRPVTQHVAVRVLFVLMFGLPYVLFGKKWACAACGHSWRRSIYDESEEDDEPREDADERREDDDEDHHAPDKPPT
jgi:hypothetical protein